MKTTIELSDAVLTAAKRTARIRGTTLRALIEEGLRRVLRDNDKAGSFSLRRASFKGTGRNPDVQNWNDMRELIYPINAE